jgi:hypothetical protein
MAALMADVVHTEQDTPAILTLSLLVETAEALDELLRRIAFN